jgi:hypothetical protein
MTAADERALFDLLRARRPRLCVIDDNVWSGSQPVVCADIVSCQAKWVHLWDPAAFPHLPTFVDSHGRLEGPQVGPVVRVERCVYESPDLLLAGTVTAGWHEGDETAAAFAKDVWAVLRKVCAQKLLEVTSKENASMYRAGDDAAHCSRTQALRLRARSSQVFFYAP